jgi:hypothetical protein
VFGYAHHARTASETRCRRQNRTKPRTRGSQLDFFVELVRQPLVDQVGELVVEVRRLWMRELAGLRNAQTSNHALP